MDQQQYAQPPVNPPQSVNDYQVSANGDDNVPHSLFSALPCPMCGLEMSWNSATADKSIGWVGLAGWLFIYPWTARYRCPQHWEINENLFSPRGKQIALMRRVLMTGGGAVTLTLAIWIIGMLM